MFALVRTSTEGKRQDGISFVLLDMDLPGITVRPIIGNGGDHEFNEVFFDNVRVPKAGRVGEENKGWEVAKYLLEFERGGALQAGRVRAQFTKLVDVVRARCADDADIAARLAEIGTDLDAMEMIDIYDAVGAAGRRQSGTGVVAVETALEPVAPDRSRELAVDAIGARRAAAVSRTGRSTRRCNCRPRKRTCCRTTPRYLNYRAYTILGGTTGNPDRHSRPRDAGTLDQLELRMIVSKHRSPLCGIMR